MIPNQSLPAVIDVDGPRPAVSWVSSLPHKWTTPAERLVLLILAADAYQSTPGRPANTSGISLSDLSRAAGIWKDQLLKILASLRTDNEHRPALLTAWVERDTAEGRQCQPLAGDERNRGGRGVRTLYQLMIPPGWLTVRGTPGQLTDETVRTPPGQLVDETVRGNRPGKPSGPRPATPFPIPSPTQVLNEPTRDGEQLRPLRTLVAVAEALHAEAVEAGRDWSQQGIYDSLRAAIDQDGRDLDSAERATREAIGDRRAHTPAALRWEQRFKAQRREQAAPQCSVCGQNAAGHAKSEEKVPPSLRHDFEAAS